MHINLYDIYYDSLLYSVFCYLVNNDGRPIKKLVCYCQYQHHRIDPLQKF